MNSHNLLRTKRIDSTNPSIPWQPLGLPMIPVWLLGGLQKIFGLIKSI